MKAVVKRTNPIPGKCLNEKCNNYVKGGKFCGTCRKRQHRLNDPVKYSYHNKKDRAKQRKIFWDLTLEEFRQFCYETDYMAKCGRTTGSFDVDRKIEGRTPGYTRSNIQILEKTENIKKYKVYDAALKRAVTFIEVTYDKKDLPF